MMLPNTGDMTVPVFNSSDWGWILNTNVDANSDAFRSRHDILLPADLS